ncbi:MAG TPA: hypothetical protein VFD43_04715 [Planctomycetota bacterium]|nr:hypothetical protein [Planctomycetota bacterium]
MSVLTALLGLLLLAPAEIVRLKDGTLVHGEIEDFDEGTGFTLRLTDTGGVVRLRWENLGAAEVRRIKESRGFTGEDTEPYLVNVVHLVMQNGTTETGLLVDDGRRDVYTLRRRNGTDSFPRQYVKSVQSGRVEGLSVYSPEDLYRVILDEQGPLATAADHLRVAVACEGAGLYPLALEHYELVRQLDPRLKPDLIVARIERARIRVEDKAETDVLDEIRNRLYKNQFDEALAMVEQFERTYPASRQLGDAAQLQAEIGRRRRDHYADRIVSDYFSFLGKSLGEIARKDGMTLGVALESLDNAVHDELLQKLAAAYTMTDEGVAQLWEGRQGGSVRTSSYGTGTFILGRQKALDWVGTGDEEDEPAGPAEPEADEDLEDRIEKLLKKRQEEAAKRAKESASGSELSEGATPDEWWEAASTDERTQFLAAYYAESSKQLQVVRTKPRNCRICQALGTIEMMNEKGEVEARTCLTCKGLKYERLVNYR